MSVFPWSRRPSAGDTSVPPRARTTSGGGLAALAGSMLSLSKAKSREKLRTMQRQTVVSTESEIEPTTPSSGSKQSFQGVGMVGDDPFARPQMYVSKEKESALALFPEPPPRRVTRTQSTSPLPTHLHPSRASSPNRSRSTSSSSNAMIVSTADMQAHADAVSWTESIYDDRSLLSPTRAVGMAAGMGSMTAMASGIVQGLDEGERRPPKRPSRSELRDPPTRKSSLLALNALESPRPRTASSPSRPQTVTSPRRPRTPSSPRLPSSPTRFIPRLSEEDDFDNYHFAIAPIILEADAQSISFSELGVQIEDDLWSDDGLASHDTRRRPPPSPTSLPFMAGNVHRRPRDMVYPSGVHTIPIADRRALADIDHGPIEQAVVGHVQLAIEEEHDRRSSPSPSPAMSTTSKTSSCSSIAPDAVPPQTISSHMAFSKHARTASYSDSDLDEVIYRKPLATVRTQTAAAWRCAAGNPEKCCSTRAVQDGPNVGGWKCCAQRTTKHAICCASYVGRPCERPRVSSTSSAELKRQRSLRGFFRPHTSHGKSTSSALLDDETRAMIRESSREDPGPVSPASGSSPPTSPASRHEFKAMPIISPAKLHDHMRDPLKIHDHMRDLLNQRDLLKLHDQRDLKSPHDSKSPPHKSPILTKSPILNPNSPILTSNSPILNPKSPILNPKSPILDPKSPKSPTLEPETRTRSDTTTSTRSGSIFSTHSEDAPAPMRSLYAPRPRRNQVSLPALTSSAPAQQPRRYVQSIASVIQPRGSSSDIQPRAPLVSDLSSIASTSSGLSSSAIFTPRGLPPPPPPRRDTAGRTHNPPIVSFISSHSAPNPGALRHSASRESCESSQTVRRRSIPLRHTRSFLELGLEEEEEEEESDEGEDVNRPLPAQSFLDLDLTRLSGDTMRETDAMFSKP